MDNDPARQAFVAANRFGYGLRPGELAVVQADPRGWLRAQLDTIDRVPGPTRDLPSTESLLAQEAGVRRERRRAAADSDPQAQQNLQQSQRRRSVQQSRELQGARLRAAVETDQPFAERLVRFWSNHFTVAASGGRKAILRNLAFSYENEAIRANLNKDFATLLLAVEQHPAMLIYLDNDQSIGDGSMIGRRRGRGLNENLAREILELHTLGVDGGYSQADVTGLARIITGWTVAIEPVPRGRSGAFEAGEHGFRFAEPMHEPGSHALLGTTYRGRGLRQGEDALRDIARHPATARHIARKLVAHFVADDPPQTAVDTIAQIFVDTEGSLPAIHAALIDREPAWQPGIRKLKTPEDYVISVSRAIGSPGAQAPDRAWTRLAGTLGGFNQTPFTASSPAGWADDAAVWGSPDALMKRIEWANQVAESSTARIDPAALQQSLLPRNDQLALAMSRAESRAQALALLLASPDFQWR